MTKKKRQSLNLKTEENVEKRNLKIKNNVNLKKKITLKNYKWEPGTGNNTVKSSRRKKKVTTNAACRFVKNLFGIVTLKTMIQRSKQTCATARVVFN